MRVEPLVDRPILSAEDPRLEGNVNGPSLIRVPDWVERPLARYYLYFAHHQGRSIRLAFADALAGPWTLHEPGALRLEDSGFPTEVDASSSTDPRMRALLEGGWLYPHIASPDVVVDPERRELRMYFHGLLPDGTQKTRVALSRDGLHWSSLPEILGESYFRVFRHASHWYALGMPGLVYRSADGLGGFEPGPRLFTPNMRHCALLKRGDRLQVFWTQVGDAPERILVSTIELGDDWKRWHDAPPVDVRRPERAWEGADLPVEPSQRGASFRPANQLRDPAVFEEDGEHYLLWSVAGENGLAIGRLLER